MSKKSALIVLAMLIASSSFAGVWQDVNGKSVETKFAIYSDGRTGTFIRVDPIPGDITLATPLADPHPDADIRKSSISGCTWIRNLRESFVIVLDYCKEGGGKADEPYFLDEIDRVKTGLQICDEQQDDPGFALIPCITKVIGF